MKIEHKILHELARATKTAGYKILAETEGLYRKDEPVWLEIRGLSRRWGEEE